MNKTEYNKIAPKHISYEEFQMLLNAEPIKDISQRFGVTETAVYNHQKLLRELKLVPLSKPRKTKKIDNGFAGIESRSRAMNRIGKLGVILPDDWETITLEEAIRRQREERSWKQT